MFDHITFHYYIHYNLYHQTHILSFEKQVEARFLQTYVIHPHK